MKTLFYFYADWCVPCQQVGPIVDDLIRHGMSIQKINIDYETDRTKSANVLSIPTIVLAQNGTEISRLNGIKSKQDILDFYNL